MFPSETLRRAENLLAACRARDMKIATVESCTGGLIAGVITEIGGSSAVLERGFVTYANEAKSGMVGISPDLIARVGAVSEEVARAMAEGALTHAPVDAAVAVTGIAGPGGGSAQKPVGLVHIAVARRDHPTRHARHVFTGDRHAVRIATVDAALAYLTELIVA